MRATAPEPDTQKATAASDKTNEEQERHIELLLGQQSYRRKVAHIIEAPGWFARLHDASPLRASRRNRQGRAPPPCVGDVDDRDAELIAHALEYWRIRRRSSRSTAASGSSSRSTAAEDMRRARARRVAALRPRAAKRRDEERLDLQHGRDCRERHPPPFAASVQNVPPDAQMREERDILGHVSDVTPVNWNVDAGSGRK